MSYKSQYDERKRNVLDVLQKATSFYARTNDETKATSLSDIALSVQNGTFSIVVVGQFSAGKSTFLNALMKEKYLPSFSTETTATINFLRSVHESPTKKPMIRINYKDGKIEESDDVSLENIERYVTVHGDHVAQKISSVEVFLDSPFLNDGVSLVDSPGLNGLLEDHEQITRDQINRSHAAIFMFNAAQPGSKSDFEKLKGLLSRCDSVLIVLNQKDHVKKEEQTVESVINTIRENYAKYFNTTELPEIYPISSLQALVARSDRNLSFNGRNDYSAEEKERLLEDSAIGIFEERLIKYLTQGEKSQKELLSPVEKVRSFITETGASIAIQIDELSNTTDADEVRIQINALKDELDGLNERLNAGRSDIKSKVADLLRDTERDIKAAAAETKAKCLEQVSDAEDLEELEQNAQIYIRRIQNKYVDIWEDARSKAESRYRDLIRDEYQDYASSIEERLRNNDNSKEIEFSAVKLDMSMFETDVEIDHYLDQRAELLRQLDSVENRLDEEQIKLLTSQQHERKRERFEKLQERLKEGRILDFQSLGVRPGIENYTIHEERKIGGLKGAWKWVTTGSRYVDKVRIVTDSSARDDYDRRREEIQARFESDLEELEAQKRAVPDSSPELIQLKIKQIERLKEKLSRQLEELKAEYNAKTAKARKAQERKVKSHIEELIEDIEKNNLHQIYEVLKKSRDSMTNALLDILQVELTNVITRKKDEIEVREKQLSSSQEEKDKLIEELNNNKKELDNILSAADACAAEIRNIQIDKIKIS